MRDLFKKKYNGFDMLSLGVVVGLVDRFGNWWLLGLLIPLAVVSCLAERAIDNGTE